MARVVIRCTSPDVKGSARVTVVDTWNYIVIPSKGTIEKDYDIQPQTEKYIINKRITSKLTVLRLLRKKTLIT